MAKTMLTIGSKFPWSPDDYVGPPGTVALMETEKLPPNYVIFLKDSVIIEIWDVSDPETCIRPELGSYDAVMCHPSIGPVAKLGQKRVDELTEMAKKQFN